MSLLPGWIVPPLNTEAARGAIARQSVLTKPAGSLGMLETLAIRLAAVQGTMSPVCRPAATLLFAADHQVTRHGVSAYPSAVTAAMMSNFVAGGAAASVMARALGIPLTVVDVGVEFPYRVDLALEQTAIPSVTVVREAMADERAGDLRTEDAMNESVYAQALAAGAQAVDRLDPLTRVLLLGEIGIGNTTAAAAVSAALLGCAAADLVGAGTGVDGEALSRKVAVVTDALVRVSSDRGLLEPHEVVQRLGGREIAAMLGAAGRAVERGMVVLVDGFVASSSVLALVKIVPRARDFLLFSHRSAERGHQRLLAALDGIPLLDLGLRLGEASGALVAFPLLDLACRLHNEMATFASAGVPTGDAP